MKPNEPPRTASQPASDCLNTFRGAVPPAGQLIPLGLQHVAAAVVGVITPAIMISGVCGLTEEQKTTLIQASLVMTALATLLQLFPLFGRIGAGLPVIMGTSFAYVPTLTAIGGEFGFPTILGAEIIGGLVAIVFGIFVKPIHRFFPPLITGTVIFTIGLSLYPTAIKYMAGGGSAATNPDFGSLRNWAVALFTFAVALGLNNFAKGIWKLGSLLFAMVAGYLVALALGMVDFSPVAQARWLALPELMPFRIEFVPAACASLAIVYIVNSVQTIGDLSSTTMGGMDRMPTDRELAGGIIAQGTASIAGVLIGGLPTASYSQNVGIVTVNRVVNRAVFALAAFVMLAAGFVPKLSSVLSTIPQCVIGGATISVFATITMTGIRMITRDGFDARSTTVTGISVAFGVGITQVSGCLAGPGFPGWVPTVFGSSSVVVTAIMAILLNQILPGKKS
ncbi:MAG: nucleobase:cation symporter-2 family protein [Gemmiger sp.]|uniref:uracil-xanthine permease family protein n=1 Tax=Gemmiger sp. TaxID=2049027 RepID=UPI002E79C18A|nr:nucleobase:cation symporter-2 family protein [Gemmiger sp.]MEE0800530.1 nucleobase:cation symporter-2 family protein [Gemmiger sp.]